MPSYAEVVGEEVDDEEDEEYLEQADKFEAAYNFRWGCGGGGGGEEVDEEEDEQYLEQADKFEAAYNFRWEEDGGNNWLETISFCPYLCVEGEKGEHTHPISFFLSVTQFLSVTPAHAHTQHCFLSLSLSLTHSLSDTLTHTQHCFDCKGLRSPAAPTL